MPAHGTPAGTLQLCPRHSRAKCRARGQARVRRRSRDAVPTANSNRACARRRRRTSRWDVAATNACCCACRTRSTFPVAFLGALYAGVVPVAVNTLLTADDYAYMLAHSRAQALLVSGALLPTLQQAMARGGHDVKHVVVSRRSRRRNCPKMRWTLPRGRSAQSAPMRDAGGHRRRRHGVLALFVRLDRTSEGNRAHARQPALDRRALRHAGLGVRRSDVVFSAAKLFFAYGLGNALTFPLSVGATTILMAERATPQAVFQRLKSSAGRRSSAACRRSMRRCWRRRSCLHEPTSRCAAASPRVKRCRARSANGSRRTSAAKSWTGSARPRCCTSSCPTCRARFAMARPASPCPATTSNCAARTAGRSEST